MGLSDLTDKQKEYYAAQVKRVEEAPDYSVATPRHFKKSAERDYENFMSTLANAAKANKGSDVFEIIKDQETRDQLLRTLSTLKNNLNATYLGYGSVGKYPTSDITGRVMNRPDVSVIDDEGRAIKAGTQGAQRPYSSYFKVSNSTLANPDTTINVMQPPGTLTTDEMEQRGRDWEMEQVFGLKPKLIPTRKSPGWENKELMNLMNIYGGSGKMNPLAKQDWTSGIRSEDVKKARGAAQAKQTQAANTLLSQALANVDPTQLSSEDWIFLTKALMEKI